MSGDKVDVSPEAVEEASGWPATRRGLRPTPLGPHPPLLAGKQGGGSVCQPQVVTPST